MIAKEQRNAVHAWDVATGAPTLPRILIAVLGLILSKFVMIIQLARLNVLPQISQKGECRYYLI